MATQATDTIIFALSHLDVAKRTSTFGLLTSCVMLPIGILSFASTFELGDKSSTISMVLIVSEAGLFLLGIFRLFWKSREMAYVPTGSIVKGRSIFFGLKHMDKLTDPVNSGLFSADSKIESEVSGNIRMDVILSVGNKFAAVQLSQFVPYIYRPVTVVYYFTDGVAAAVAAFLTKSQLN